jgi:hypothetical protein
LPHLLFLGCNPRLEKLATASECPKIEHEFVFGMMLVR